MSAIDFNQNPIEAEVFRFVSIRGPQLPEKKKKRQMAIPFTNGNGSSLFQAMIQALDDPNHSTPAQKLSACRALALGFQADGDWMPSVEVIDAYFPDYRSHFVWLRANSKTISITAFNERVGPSNGNVSTINKAWDNLIAYLVLGTGGPIRAALMEVIILDFVRQNFLDAEIGGTDEALRNMSHARIVLPKPLFPLPGSNMEIPEIEIQNEPQDDGDSALLREQARLYSEAHAAISEIFATTQEAGQIAPTPNPLDPDGNPLPSAELRLGDPKSTGLASDILNLLKDENIGADTTFVQCLRKLEARLSAIYASLFEGVELANKVIAAGGALWRLGNKVDDPREPCDPLITPDLTGYEDFYAQDGRCRIRPLGIGDLLKVEQELCCYVPGEVAHIENILQGEYKERNTRRLKRTEQTFVSTRERETVNERDTVTTDQYELQKSTSTVMQQDQAFDIGVGVSATYGVVTANLNSNFATSTSTTTADAQASFYAQNVTERSLQRITERIREERITTVIEEFEENNKHGLDNRLGTAHVVGLYRWADKLYKMRLLNYGKRLMFEFLIPEPAAFHLWATARPDTSVNVPLVEPIDPTSSAVSAFGLQPLDLRRVASWDYHLWGKAYGVVLDPPPAEWRTITKAYHETDLSNAIFAKSYNDIKVPEGYRADAATVYGMVAGSQAGSFMRIHISTGSPAGVSPIQNTGFRIWILQGNHVDLIPISVAGVAEVFSMNVVVTCQRLPETYAAWQRDCFGKIMEAYRALKSSYDNALKEAKEGFGIGRIDTSPAMNRQVEHNELKKGCINWLHYGGRFHADGILDYDSTDDCQPPRGLTDCCVIRDTERIKFLEQVFDWRNMTYQFYPYFYGQQCRWKKLYQIQQADQLFANFLQAGMARVLVPARLGFEEQAMEYLRSGQIWSGGPIPVYDSDLQTSILLDLYPGAESNPEIATWEMRVPTTLTVLQCESGCTSGDGLPCSCGNGIGAGSHAHMVGTTSGSAASEPSTHA